MKFSWFYISCFNQSLSPHSESLPNFHLLLLQDAARFTVGWQAARSEIPLKTKANIIDCLSQGCRIYWKNGMDPRESRRGGADKSPGTWHDCGCSRAADRLYRRKCLTIFSRHYSDINCWRSSAAQNRCVCLGCINGGEAVEVVFCCPVRLTAAAGCSAMTALAFHIALEASVQLVTASGADDGANEKFWYSDSAQIKKLKLQDDVLFLFFYFILFFIWCKTAKRTPTRTNKELVYLS